MLHRRITNEGSDIGWIKELETRISRLETPAMGNVAARGLITITDPVTGVQTQIGALPDGRSGIKEFVYDITPPPVATAPVVKAEPGVFIISWNGLFANGDPAPADFECCNIIAHKIENGSTVSSIPVGMTRRPLDITFVQTDIAVPGETWQFSLEAEDTNGNRAEWSVRSPIVTMLAVEGVVDLTEIEADIQLAKDDAATAQSVAAQASTDAADAADAALAASNLAASKGKVLFQTTAPTGDDANAQTLWIDTTNGAYTPKRWTGDTTWVVATDKAATDAATAAQNAYNLAASKGKVLFQTTAPTGADANAQTLWIDTTNGANTPKRWTTGTTWVVATDKVATDAAAAATAATNLATSKGKVIIQTTAPAVADRLVQNLWIDTTGGANTPKRWDTATSTWIVVTDKVATDAAAAAAAAQTTANQASAAAATAAEAAGNAQTTANGKNRVWYQDDAPAGTTHRNDDIWFDTNNDNKISRWNATSSQWVESLIGNAAILGNLDAGKITVGYIKAAVLAAKSITVDKLVISSTDNLAVEADFTAQGASWSIAHGAYVFATGGRSSSPSLRFTGTTGSMLSFNLNNRFTVDQDARFRGSVVFKSTTALPVNSIFLVLRCYTAPGTATFTDITIATNAVYATPGSFVTFKGLGEVLPIGTLSAEIYLHVINPTVGTVTDIDFLSVTRASDGNLIVDGSVTAAKLETDLVLTTRVIAGDSSGTHAEMSPSGFKVFAANAATGIPSEVVRLGVASTDDYFAVTRADESLAATIDQDGKIVGDKIYATSGLFYKGDSIDTILGRRSTGIIGWAQRTTPSTANANNSQRFPYLRLKVNVKAGRAYKVSTTPIQSNAGDSATAVTLRLVYAMGADALPFDNTLTVVTTSDEGTGSLWQTPVTLSGMIYASTDTTLSVMVAFGANGPSLAAVQASTSNPVAIYIEDIGLQVPQTGEYMDGTTPAPTPVQNYYKEFALTGASSYKGDNTYYAYAENKMFQGDSPGGVGNTKSIATFQSMTGDLSGATISDMRVYLYFDTWYYNAGGTARIGLHTHSTPPATFSHSVADAMISSGWPKPGGRWVGIPSTYWAGFKAGTYKGISLAAPGGYEYYGYASENALISVSYTK